MDSPSDKSELEGLIGHSDLLRGEYLTGEEMWKDSPFAWIRSRQSRQKGAIGEKLVSLWLESHGFDVARSSDSEADRLIEGKRVEIKFSTLWDGLIYKFQQLRDQNYDFAICIGISPFDAHCWVLEKEAILRHWHEDERTISPQHGGRQGTDTAWFSVDPEAVPAWLNGYGGSLEDGLRRISDLTGFKLPH